MWFLGPACHYQPPCKPTSVPPALKSSSCLWLCLHFCLWVYILNAMSTCSAVMCGCLCEDVGVDVPVWPFRDLYFPQAHEPHEPQIAHPPLFQDGHKTKPASVSADRCSDFKRPSKAPVWHLIVAHCCRCGRAKSKEHGEPGPPFHPHPRQRTIRVYFGHCYPGSRWAAAKFNTAKP